MEKDAASLKNKKTQSNLTNLSLSPVLFYFSDVLNDICQFIITITRTLNNEHTQDQQTKTESMEFMNGGFIDIGEQGERLLLLGHTDGTTTTAGGLSVLTTHTQTGEREKRKSVHQSIPKNLEHSILQFLTLKQ